MTFLVAGSGLGKSVACYRKLARHIDAGGAGLVLFHEVLASAVTIEQAIFATLRQLHPSLATAGSTALSFCSPERPLLLIVEDINRSGQAQALAEKLATWSRMAGVQEGKGSSPHWRLICPMWPEFLMSMTEQSRKSIEPLILTAGGFTEAEGRDAVMARAKLDGRHLTTLAAEEISRSLGHDPLLIALYEYGSTPEPHRVIGQFVDGSVSRAAATVADYPATDYRQALRKLAGQILISRNIEPGWNEVNAWEGLRGDSLRLLSRLAHCGELIRLTGPSDNQRIFFRHDRVRDWLLADAAGELDRRDDLAQEVIEDPYFAEIMGGVLTWGQPKPDFLQRIAIANPLALFQALRLFGETHSPHREAILDAANQWLNEPSIHERSKLHLRWEALSMLAEADFPEVPTLVHRFNDQTTSGQLARFRNGDISGGIELCLSMEPGVSAPWRDIQIDHVKLRFGRDLIGIQDSVLRRDGLDSATRIGTLRLAGHLADSSIASAIEACWLTDQERNHHLTDYLWAFAECCGDDPARYLEPVCNAWAALSDQPETQGMSSPRDELAADQLRWAFRKWPPVAALDYFVQRGMQNELRWPITFMLHGMDHPTAVSFVVHELAAIQRRLAGSDSFSPFVMSAQDDWRRAQEDGRPMSPASRGLLLELWKNEINDSHLRKQAFSLWSATRQPNDLDVLRAAKASGDLDDKILWERLVRGDENAIPAMIDKLGMDNHGYWWQCGKYLWSPELTHALDDALNRRGTHAKRIWGESLESDWITAELIMRLPTNEAERLLVKHWPHLRFGPRFVQAALYVATPLLLEAVQACVNECPDPAILFKYISQHYGIRIKDRAGLIDEAQVHALAPYLHLLSPIDLWSLWGGCNNRGWFNTRQTVLDRHLAPEYRRRLWHRENVFLELDEMVSKQRQWWIDRWLDDFMETGVLWNEIVATMSEWLDQRRSLEVLQVVASAIVHRGSREDLRVLSGYKGMQDTMARWLIADSQFAVRRRRIS